MENSSRKGGRRPPHSRQWHHESMKTDKSELVFIEEKKILFIASKSSGTAL